ncbi:MAG: PD-(D/E)XK nuclease family protein [Clostridia bacterium]|nr:PD-(D/E)XK nuclease family protein [Clostridia bacterium]
MLYLILSRTGGGKTTHIMNLAEQFANGGRKTTLIVPEQFSFMSEKIMLGKMGAKAMADIDVMSFTSLGEKLVGKPALHERRRLDDSAKAALMSMALEAVRDKLRLYKKHTGRRSVISEFAALSSEFKQNALSTDSVRLAMAGMEEGLLKMKLSDIVNVLDAYDAMVEGSYFNPDDLLDELCDVLPDSDYFNGRIVFIDSFRGFTAQEFKVIEHMLQKSAAVYVTLCTDNLENADDETDLFAHTKRTAKKLIDIARKNAVAVAKPQYLSMRNKFNNFPPKLERFASAELSALEQELFSPSPNIYEEKCENIVLCKAADIYAECEFVACTAKKLIREKGYRCRDIAVIARNSGDYEAPLSSALRKCGIGVFDDSRQPVDASPVVALVSSAVQIAANGFDTETFMRYLKTGLAGLGTEEISELENYCYLWQINGKGWLRDWEKNPRGLGVETTEEDVQTLEALNALRIKAAAPLCELRRAFENVKGAEAANAVYSFLEDINAAESIRSLAKKLNKQGESSIALELERLWNVVMDILDSLETLFRDRYITAREFSEAMELMLSAQTVGSLPQGLDEITVGSADRIRIVSPKAVFIVGANSGVFPAAPSSGTALTDNDRRKMSEMGLELSGFGEYKLAEEKLIAYNSFCCASEKLYVCCPERNAKGEQLAPSELYIKIKQLFPECIETDASQLNGMYYIEGEALAFEQLAKTRGREDAFSKTLNEYFINQPEYSGRLAALERAAGSRNFAISDKEAAKTLFGKNMFVSASRVESYHKCPFSYFCRYGIKAVPRKIAELDPMQKGNIIHFVLEKLLTDYKGEALLALSRKDIFDYISALMREYLIAKLGGEEQSERFMYLYNKLAVSVCDVAERLIAELAKSDFEPVDFELQIGSDGDIPPYELDFDTGKISISGAVDRVDTAVINGRKYIRIVDYKSSGKKFKLSDVMQGLNMQMLIYLFTLWQNGKERYGEVTPAGVLYYAAKSPQMSAERNADRDKLKESMQKDCRSAGIVLNDCDVVLAMDRDASGFYIPVDFKKGKMSGSLISLKQLELLKNKADKILAEMANELHSGNIPALPVSGANYKSVCDYCDYKSVCGFEENIPVYELDDMKDSETLELLEKGAEADEVDG